MHKIHYFDFRLQCASYEPKIVEKARRITENELSKHDSVFVPVFAHVKYTENLTKNYRRRKMVYLGDPASKFDYFGLMERAFICRLQIGKIQYRRRIFVVGGRIFVFARMGFSE